MRVKSRAAASSACEPYTLSESAGRASPSSAAIGRRGKSNRSLPDRRGRAPGERAGRSRTPPDSAIFSGALGRDSSLAPVPRISRGRAADENAVTRLLALARHMAAPLETWRRTYAGLLVDARPVDRIPAGRASIGDHG